MKLLRITFLLLLSVTVLSTSFAQNGTPAAPQKSVEELKADLQAVQEKADQEVAKVAAKNEKYKAKGKTDKVQPEVASAKTLKELGDAYTALATSEETPEEQVDEYIEQAKASYLKIKEVEEEKGSVYQEVFNPEAPANVLKGGQSSYDVLYNHFFQAGANAFNENDYQAALENLERAFNVKPEDTTAGKYAFYAAATVAGEASDEEAIAAQEKTVELINKLKALDFVDPNMYYQELTFVSKKAAPYEEEISSKQYDIKEAKGNIEKLNKELEQATERADYYGKGAGKRYRGSAQKAAENKKAAADAKAQLEEEKAKLAKLESDVKAAQEKANEVYAQALEVAKQGLEVMPEDETLNAQVVSYYARLDRLDDAIGSIESQLAAKPKDEMLNFNLAVLYDQSAEKAREDGDMAKSQEYFDKAAAQYDNLLSINPENTDGLYNASALYYNRATVYNRELNDLPRSASGSFKDKAKATELEGKIAEMTAKAEPLATKAKDVKPDEAKYWELLARIYTLTKKYDEAEAALKKADELR
ncbi:hypothetical protein V6R21_31535 [Limibacter armeniacum]|uniref:hypothetical protein n=1 Tax=Limibacter armeniacum TaxID=466084 RepID=UPI002FE69938